MNVHHVDSWSEIQRGIMKRVFANRKRLAACNDEEVRPIIQRIADDDERRFLASREWIQYYQQGA